MARPTAVPEDLSLDMNKTTDTMRKSLKSLHSCLLCPLCQKLLKNPSTLPACVHTFCKECIDDYTRNSWTCPFPGCGMPVAVRGSRDGSIYATNPQLQTVTQSLETICSALNRARTEWWKEPTSSADREDLKIQTGPDQRYRLENLTDRDNNDNARGEKDDDSQGTKKYSQLSIDSPSLSPIAIECSPDGNETNRVFLNTPAEDANERPPKKIRVSFGSETSENSEPPQRLSQPPRVYVGSKLPKRYVELLAELEEEEALNVVEEISDKSVICVCANAEMETGDGYLVSRTFGYLWACAFGAPIVNISYFEQAPPFGSLEGTKHQVIGDAESEDWMAPQRSMKMTPRKLLEKFVLILCGEFDILQRRRRQHDDTSQIYSRDRIKLLGKLCGASVLSVEELANLEYAKQVDEINSDSSGRVAFVIKTKPHSRDWRAAKKLLSEHPTLERKSHPIVSANWLLDCIGNFKVKKFGSYTQK